MMSVTSQAGYNYYNDHPPGTLPVLLPAGFSLPAMIGGNGE
jgi:hypothetical protein